MEQCVAAERSSRDSRPLLIIVSDSPRWPERVRSRTRTVRSWAPADTGAAAGSFAGDPGDARTYEWARTAPGVIGVFELQPAERARAAVSALRQVRPDAAALLLTAEPADLDRPRDGTLVRSGGLRDVLRLDLDEELQRLEAERRAYCLREFARGTSVVPILIHRDPDPDAVSSALAVATLLGGSPDTTPIVTLDPMSRPENRRLAELLHITVTRVTIEELRGFERVITVDTQPGELQQDGRPRLAVIDHHPAEEGYVAEFRDIRPSYGATATMLTEYLLAGGNGSISSDLASALLFGISTDTSALTRGVTAADVEAYAYLQDLADTELVRRLQQPSYSVETARRFGAALQAAEFDGDLCVAFIGELDPASAHTLADVADFCLGVENITWVAAAALLGGELVLTLRHAGPGPGAGALARALAARGGAGGRGGGHRAMARMSMPQDRAWELLGTDRADAAAGAIRQLIRAARAELEQPA
jgi:nanoRNase/pAp phosphatase (c-di-AMP/oligoRNAs hydrolase)